MVSGHGQLVNTLPRRTTVPREHTLPTSARTAQYARHQTQQVAANGFEIGCDNKEKVRVAFALDCCDREAIAHVATTEGIKSQDVQDLVITAVENRFGRINMLSEPIEWLTDNGSCFIAKDTASLLREIGMEPCTTPVRSPQSKEQTSRCTLLDWLSVN